MDIMKLVSSHAALCLFLRAIADTEKLFSEYVIYHLLCCGNSKFLDKFNEKNKLSPNGLNRMLFLQSGRL